MAMSDHPLPTMRRRPVGFAGEPGAVGGVSAVGVDGQLFLTSLNPDGPVALLPGEWDVTDGPEQGTVTIAAAGSALTLGLSPILDYPPMVALSPPPATGPRLDPRAPMTGHTGARNQCGALGNTRHAGCGRGGPMEMVGLQYCSETGW